MYPVGEPDVIDLGSRHFLRAHHELIRTHELEGHPVLATADSPVVGLMWWHDCPKQESTWILVPVPTPEVLEHPVCGDRGKIRAGRWRKA